MRKMKTKRITAGLLCGLMSLSMITACSNGAGTSSASQATQDSAAVSKPKAVKLHTLTIRAPKDIEEMTATFLNTSTGKTADVKMEKSAESERNIIFTCEADVNLYNMVHLNYGKTTGMDVAFNSFVSGWNLDNDELLPYSVGTEPVYDPEFDTKVFQFDGRDKNVYIWKPADYDKNSDEKYSVIYLFDGQTVLATGKERGMDNDVMCWNVSESVAGMMTATDNKAIIVAIDNGSPFRSDELIPNLGICFWLQSAKSGYGF